MNNYAEIQRINNIIATVFEIDICDINESLTPEDIEKWDSMGQLFLIISIENEFGTTLNIDEIFSINNIGDIYKVLSNMNIEL
jgi:acyl carrier protein